MKDINNCDCTAGKSSGNIIDEKEKAYEKYVNGISEIQEKYSIEKHDLEMEYYNSMRRIYG